MGGLPVIVERYLQRALGAMEARGPVHRFAQEGELRTGRSSRWMPFTATHMVREDVAQFRWEARVRAAPFIHLRVTDELRQGIGSGAVRLGCVPISSAAGTLPMHSGSLHRYLAESVWYPAALRPSPHLRWIDAGDRRATAVLRDGAVEVALDFGFDEQGDVASVYTSGRWGRFGREFRQVAWEGHFHEYGETRGVRMPGAADVGWHDGNGWEPVWRARVVPVADATPD